MKAPYEARSNPGPIVDILEYFVPPGESIPGLSRPARRGGIHACRMVWSELALAHFGKQIGAQDGTDRTPQEKNRFGARVQKDYCSFVRWHLINCIEASDDGLQHRGSARSKLVHIVSIYL